MLEDDEAAWGMFEELGTYRMEQNIPFDRVSDGKYEHSPEFHRFRPCSTNGDVALLEVDRTFLCGHNNRPVAAVVDIKKAVVGTQMPRELAARPVELCGLDISNLPPPSIVEAAG